MNKLEKFAVAGLATLGASSCKSFSLREALTTPPDGQAPAATVVTEEPEKEEFSAELRELIVSLGDIFAKSRGY